MTVTRHELDQLLAILREAAAIEIMPRFRRLDPTEIHSKGDPLDLVTCADEGAERFVADRVVTLWPGTAMVGEEACARGPEPLAALTTARRAVVLDPIDGTANFAAGTPLFGVMAAIVEDGQVEASAILDPVSGDAALALRREGAWLDRDGRALRPLRAAAPAALSAMVGKTAWRSLPAAMREQATGFLARVGGLWDYRCAAHEYLQAADGHCHFLMYTRTLPWDHLPGSLLLQEAGAYGAHFDGTPYTPGHLKGGLLYAPDQASWLTLRDGMGLSGLH
ncbi:inositol monophosphatase family protein [Tanticharoenia sakaeratensis]|uniref:Inositol monophosphatase n=1 Tax=Tanticharoenia sakaeratensis NBRC 103193 TaxID=1231623 RepID=A0A0D6MKJ5_9PROT|nr:inositol monophosphatase family protein [Tanticharoenia sakaeratensis]GAN53996.1 inositol monophosphatase [Tanticharoenia sakaeratensis NBRC 103193]GBQ23067.1 inositol monophosphatase [Tanticharoenia sakaeratensis NBRC 103193]